jgi:PAS domain S-box-containing protein
MKTMTDVKAPLPKKWPWIALFVGLSAAAAIGGHVYYQAMTRAAHARAYEELHSVASLKVRQIIDWRKERIADVQGLVSSPFFSEAVVRAAQRPDDEEARNRLHKQLMVVTNDPRYDDVLIVDLDGNILVSAKKDAGGLDQAAKALVGEALSSRGPVFGDFYECAERKAACIDVVAPVLDEGERPAAALVLRIDPASDLFSLIQWWPSSSKTAETWLVRRDGDHALFLNELRHRRGTAMRLRIPLTQTNTPAVRALSGAHDHFEGVDYRGAHVLADVHPVPGTPWFMGAEVDTDEAMAEGRRLSLFIVVVTAGIMLLAAAGTRLIYVSRQRGLYEELYRYERERSEAREELRAALYSIGDGVITADPQGIVRHINPVAEKLTGWSASDAAGRPLDEVFRIINEHTREKVENPADKVLREGKTVGLANHTVLVAKNGAEIPIAAGGAPIRDENDKIIGVVLVFRDQTEERAAQKAIQLERAKLLSIFDQVEALIQVTDPATHEIIYMNHYGQKLFGCDPVGKKCYEVFQSRDTVCSLCENKGVMELGGAPHRWEFHSEGLDRDFIAAHSAIKWPDGRLVMLELAIDDTERKRIERELTRARKDWESIFQAIGHVTFIIDLQGVILSANRAALDAVGKPREEVIGKKCHEIFHGLDHHPIGCPLMKVRLTGDVAVEEMEVEALGGYYLVSCTPVVNERGEVDRVIHIATDITARKRAEEALRENEERYRSIVEEGFDGIFVQKGLDIVYANAVVERMLGYDEGELVGMDHSMIHPPELREVVRARALARMRGETMPQGFEVRLQRKDGSVFDGEINAGLVEVEGEPGVRVWVRDISERKRQQEIRRRLVTAVEQAAEGIVIADVRGDVLYVNPAHERITGYSAEEVIGGLPPMFRKDELDIATRRAINGTLKRGVAWSGRIKGRRKDGAPCVIDVTLSPVKDDTGRMVNMVGVERDVTEEVQLQQQLLQAQKMEAVGALAGGVAHDFNNILQVVLGFTELLLTEKAGDASITPDLGKVQRAAKAGADLVKRLLLFSRKAEPRLVPMNLNQGVVEVEQLIRRTIPRMIEIRLDLAQELPRIYADPLQVEQILMNLAVNARDAMPDGGTLTLTTGAATIDQDYCRFHPEAVPGDHVFVEMKDTGHGMDRSTMQRIFEPFFTTKQVGRGTGLGLAMVHGIVKLHHGHITVYSEVGKGTAFRVYFPVIEEDEETDSLSSTAEMPASGTETILLVDDEPVVRELGARILAKSGYTVLEASDGREALEIFRRERARIGLVILDLIMPKMGGKECLEELLKIDPHVKTLVASGYSEEAAEQCLRMGAKGFLPKPFEVKKAPALVRKVLDEG